METNLVARFKEFFERKSIYFFTASMLYYISFYFPDFAGVKVLTVIVRIVALVLCYKYIAYFYTEIQIPLYRGTREKPTGVFKKVGYRLMHFFLCMWYSGCFLLTTWSILTLTEKLNFQTFLIFLSVSVMGGMVGFALMFTRALLTNEQGEVA